jgi:uncharacterized membrane protein
VLFFVYGFLGWCVEVVYATLHEGKFINRGFLTGPICPIYGVGLVSVLQLLTRFKENIVVLFLGSILLTTTLELITGYVLEKVFHQKWWDYSMEPFNFRGYISAKFSLQWGIACVFVVKVIHPLIEKVLFEIPESFIKTAVFLFFLSFITDMIFAVMTVLKIRRRLVLEEKLQQLLKKQSYLIGENLSDVTITLMKLYEKAYKGSEAGIIRLKKAFPDIDKIKEKNKELIDRIKKTIR